MFFIFFKDKLSINKIMNSFGLMNILNGPSFNFICGAFTQIKRNNFISNLLLNIWVYIPGCLLDFLFVKILPLCNNHPKILIFFNGIKICTTGIILGFIPRIWYWTCYNNDDIHWCISTGIVAVGFLCFYKGRNWLGFVSPFVLEAIISFI